MTLNESSPLQRVYQLEAVAFDRVFFSQRVWVTYTEATQAKEAFARSCMFKHQLPMLPDVSVKTLFLK